jgi:osmotically-inducible protein OsmY
MRKTQTDAPATAERNQALNRAVHDALFRYDPLRSSLPGIQVMSSEGNVTLSGLVRSRMMKAMAATLAGRVPGVAGVQYQLLTDADIETAVALEMAGHAGLRKADGAVRVKSIMGTVYLMGDIGVESVAEAESLKQQAERIAQGVAGVLKVVNSVVARERGQVVVATTEAGASGGPSGAVAARLAELRERRANWSERAGVAG